MRGKEFTYIMTKMLGMNIPHMREEDLSFLTFVLISTST